ncbi:hypothetical protein C8R46DRAFT_1256644 [Mycena filopes]|nr:hypothetical protein C8R46DRAFT_1256644 [Mycena filopes]
MKRIPAVPLHPHVYEVALDQLESGASVSAIQTKNIEMLTQKTYREMDSYHPETANVRYKFLPSDSRHLYRLYNRANGIDVTFKPQYNIHNWLDPESPHFHPDIYRAIFHYAARSEKGERLKVCIATEEMNAAAWKYAHESQLILDGTFGVSSSRMLLFIAMGIDEDGKGVPLAFFLFSAPTGTQATHAGYNTEILRELLKSWKQNLSRGNDLVFTPFVCITDTDVRERAALQQCWTNKRKALKLVPTQDHNFWKDYVHGQLLSLEEQLIASTDIDSDAETAAQAAFTYLDYLVTTWMSDPLWQSWAQHGRIVASQLLKVPVGGVLPTTKHLESFNGLLKKKYLPQWQRSGTRLRIDFLILILITKILPEIFSHRRTIREHKEWLRLRFSTDSLGINLTKIRKSSIPASSVNEGNLCWWPADAERQTAADAIVRLSRIYDIRQTVNLHQYEATCIASRGLLHDPNHPRYYVYIHCDGYAACTCPDFTSRGAACKHLRALRLILEHWVAGGQINPFYYPTTADAARNVRNLTPTAAAVLQNFLALQKVAGEDTTATDDDENNEEKYEFFSGAPRPTARDSNSCQMYNSRETEVTALPAHLQILTGYGPRSAKLEAPPSIASHQSPDPLPISPRSFSQMTDTSATLSTAADWTSFRVQAQSELRREGVFTLLEPIITAPSAADALAAAIANIPLPSTPGSTSAVGIAFKDTPPERNSRALGIITKYLSTELALEHLDESNAGVLWAKLRKRFEEENAADTAMGVLTSLFATKLAPEVEGEPFDKAKLTTHIGVVRSHLDTLTRLKFPFSAELQPLILLGTLPDNNKWASIKGNIISSLGTGLNWDKVRARIIGLGKEPTHPDDEVAMVSKPQSSSKAQSSSSSGDKYCLRHGHNKSHDSDHCFHLKNLVQEDKKGKSKSGKQTRKLPM